MKKTLFAFTCLFLFLFCFSTEKVNTVQSAITFFEDPCLCNQDVWQGYSEDGYQPEIGQGPCEEAGMNCGPIIICMLFGPYNDCAQADCLECLDIE